MIVPICEKATVCQAVCLHAINEFFLFGTFYGMIIISLCNYLVHLAIRERKNLYCNGYLLRNAVYALSLDGIGFQYLRPARPAWNDYRD
jgi:two-component system, sensor histidine kinase LadS